VIGGGSTVGGSNPVGDGQKPSILLYFLGSVQEYK
jgi:hypothetical protein